MNAAREIVQMLTARGWTSGSTTAGKGSHGEWTSPNGGYIVEVLANPMDGVTCKWWLTEDPDPFEVSHGFLAAVAFLSDLNADRETVEVAPVPTTAELNPSRRPMTLPPGEGQYRANRMLLDLINMGERANVDRDLLDWLEWEMVGPDPDPPDVEAEYVTLSPGPGPRQMFKVGELADLAIDAYIENRSAGWLRAIFTVLDFTDDRRAFTPSPRLADRIYRVAQWKLSPP